MMRGLKPADWARRRAAAACFFLYSHSRERLIGHRRDRHKKAPASAPALRICACDLCVPTFLERGGLSASGGQQAGQQQHALMRSPRQCVGPAMSAVVETCARSRPLRLHFGNRAHCACFLQKARTLCPLLSPISLLKQRVCTVSNVYCEIVIVK